MKHQTNAMFVVENGLLDMSVIPLDEHDCVLGRSLDADIVLNSPFVSGLHAQITWEGTYYSICDLKSKNGTTINSAALGPEGRRLHDGDLIELAQGKVALRFRDTDSTVTLPLASQPRPGTGRVLVDGRSREVWVQEKGWVDPPLSRKEFDVLNLLYQRKGEVCSREEIAASGWRERMGDDWDVTNEEIDQCIRRIRLRIEPDPNHPRYIITRRGHGYRLDM